MENTNSKKKLRMVGRNQIMNFWKVKNIYTNKELDMSGMRFDEKNFVSIHHIFGRGDNNKGLAVIGRLFHDYIDSYLLPNDTNEYVRWNNYFAKLYKYSVYYSKTCNKEKLIKECNILLCNILKNKSFKAKLFIDKLRPYLNERLSRYIVEAFESTKFNEEDYIPRMILRNKKVVAKENNERLLIDKEYTSVEIKKYFRRKLTSYFLTKENYVDLLYKIFPQDIEELDYKYKIRQKNISDNSREYIASKSIPKHDWMGSIAYPEQIVEGEFFLTKVNKEILDYIQVNNKKLYRKWLEIFEEYKKENYKEQKLVNKSLTLRNKTIEYIYYGVLSQPGKVAVKNRITKKYNLMTEEEKRKTYCEIDQKGQLAVAFVFFMNQLHREAIEKEKRMNMLQREVIVKKPKLTVDYENIHYDNIVFPFKNDEMGNDFKNKEYVPLDQSRINTNFLSKDSLRTLSLLGKRNKGLFARWIRYLDYVNEVRNRKRDFFADNKQRRDTLFRIHKELTELREETRMYFEKRKKSRKSETKLCEEMVDLYQPKEIKFFIKNKSNAYYSEEFINRYDKYIERKQETKTSDPERKRISEEYCLKCESFKVDNDCYNNYIKDIYDRKFSSSCSNDECENIVSINRTEDFRALMSRQCHNDALGIYFGLTTDEEMNVPELLGFDIFITEQSYNILKFLKENNPDLFSKWVELLKKKVSNEISEDEYSDEQFEILVETSKVLKRNFKKFDSMLKLSTIKVGKAVASMKRTRNKDN